MKLPSKGQVTVPREFREKYGLHPHTEVIFESAADGVLIKPSIEARRQTLRRCLRRSRGSATAKLSTNQIMDLTRGDG